MDKKCAVAVFEIATEKFAGVKASLLKYKEPSKFPAIDIDVTFSADVSAINFPEVTDLARAASAELLRSVFVKDIYTAEDGAAAITLRFSFSSTERTLTKQELAPAVDAITAELAKIKLIVKN